MNAFSMDCFPRISRAQVFNALSSMANISGYRAVIEAAKHFPRFFTGQITAVGKVPPAKILVIGGGVAGFGCLRPGKKYGIGQLRNKWENLGVEFLTIDITEEGGYAGGYSKKMSKEFAEAFVRLAMSGS